MGEVRMMSETAAKWYAKRGSGGATKSETFQNLSKCPVCHKEPAMPIGNVPKEGEREICMFCDCLADLMLLRWMEKAKRFDEERTGWLIAPICNNCLKSYLDERGNLKFGDLLIDSGAV